MVELYRLQAESEQGPLTLVLTASHVILEPSAEFRTSLTSAFSEAREGSKEIPGFAKWIVEKATTFADKQIEQFLQPHPLKDVSFSVLHDELTLSLGWKSFHMGNLKVNRADAAVFRQKFEEAKLALVNQ